MTSDTFSENSFTVILNILLFQFNTYRNDNNTSHLIV